MMLIYCTLYHTRIYQIQASFTENWLKKYKTIAVFPSFALNRKWSMLSGYEAAHLSSDLSIRTQ